jgi:hypothetical protein
MLLISAAALASAALTVWSVMATTVLERRAEIAIMQATGAANWLVAALFAAEVAVEGAAGGLIGALAGVQLARWVGEAVFQAPASAPALLVPLTVLVAARWRRGRGAAVAARGDGAGGYLRGARDVRLPAFQAALGYAMLLCGAAIPGCGKIAQCLELCGNPVGWRTPGLAPTLDPLFV